MLTRSTLIGVKLKCKPYGDGRITEAWTDGSTLCFKVHFNSPSFEEKSYGYPQAFLNDFFETDDTSVVEDIDLEKYKAGRPSKMAEREKAEEEKKAKEKELASTMDITSLLSYTHSGGIKLSKLFKKDDIDDSKTTEEKETEKRKSIAYLKSRGVTHLIHFTPIRNLPGILKYGILPRDMIPEDVESILMDNYRLDKMRSCSCFSVMFPNYKMLYTRTKNTKEPLAVMEISIDVLEEFDYDSIYFIPTNAANHGIKVGNGRYKGEHWAQNLFKKSEGDNRREDLEIPDYYTTDPQAEIMLKGKVSIEFIDRICVNTSSDYSYVVSYLNNTGKIPLGLNKNYFGPRCDYAHW